MKTFIILWNEAKGREEAVRVSGTIPVCGAETASDALLWWEGDSPIKEVRDLNSVYVHPYTGTIFAD